METPYGDHLRILHGPPKDHHSYATMQRRDEPVGMTGCSNPLPGFGFRGEDMKSIFAYVVNGHGSLYRNRLGIILNYQRDPMTILNGTLVT